jgi:hypothetical protein
MMLCLTTSTLQAQPLAQQANYDKMSGRLISVLDHYTMSESNARRAGQTLGDPVIMALVKADSEEALTSQGVTVLDHIDDIYFTAMPVSRVAPLSLDNRVTRMEVSREVREHMDRTPDVIGVRSVWNGGNDISGVKLPQAYKGKGVLVGICDSGFDFLHPMFRNADGTSRIKWAWDAYTGRGTTEGL